MATCRRMTIKERVAAAEKQAGRALTAEAKKAISLSLVPAPYVCTGGDVGSLAGTKPSGKKLGRFRKRGS